MARLLFNKFKGDKVRVLLSEGHMVRQCTHPKRPRNSAWFKEKLMLAEAQESGQTDDLYAYDSDCDDISSTKAVLMANLSSYSLDVLSELSKRMSSHVTNWDTANHETKIVNESLTAGLERKIKALERKIAKKGKFSIDTNLFIIALKMLRCNGPLGYAVTT
ncbi:hypothetical protein Tco_0623915 [Tanacetum coccineum]|uniref:Uncharacterized protein n=1 Tax=Tanacetum coccineum TaxID=301880 RepID=A0ABQ4WCD7_9ASTR